MCNTQYDSDYRHNTCIRTIWQYHRSHKGETKEMSKYCPLYDMTVTYLYCNECGKHDACKRMTTERRKERYERQTKSLHTLPKRR